MNAMRKVNYPALKDGTCNPPDKGGQEDVPFVRPPFQGVISIFLQEKRRHGFLPSLKTWGLHREDLMRKYRDYCSVGAAIMSKTRAIIPVHNVGLLPPLNSSGVLMGFLAVRGPIPVAGLLPQIPARPGNHTPFRRTQVRIRVEEKPL